METEELCSINIFPLVTIPFAIQWSPDNQISIITEGGIHILELQPSPMSPTPTVKFARSFIYPSDTFPAYEFASMIDSVRKMDREEFNSLLMEEAITPKKDGVNDTVLRIIKVEWSPKNMISPSQCILAILTAAGAVELLHKVSNEWYSICDISSLRLSVVQNKIKSSLADYTNTNVNQYEIITKNIRQLQACSIVWSELFKVKNISFAYFSVAYRNGDICIWKIPRISNFTASLNPIIVGKIDLKVAINISMLCWVSVNSKEHILIVGYFDGQIYGVKLKCKVNDIKVISTEKYMSTDHITVNHFHVISKDKSHIKVFAIKSFHILLLCINWTGTLKSMQHLQIEGFNITGISPISAQQFLISTKNARTFVIDIESNNLVCNNIKSHLPQTKVQYLGLTQSLNKAMFVNVTSPKMVFDHLVIREPSIIHIFILKGAEWDPMTIINNSMSLTNVWDCMEVLRVKAVKVEDPSTILCPLTEKMGSLSVYKLQVSMWITVMINVCKMKKPIPNIDHIRESKISRAFPLIFVHSTCAYLNSLMKKRTLSSDQMLAVSLLRKYLEIYLASEANDEKSEEDNENARRCAQEALNATVSCQKQIEKCNFCGDQIHELWNVTSCPSGHKLPRCAVTLLQITSLEYCVCRICYQMFHQCLQEIDEEPRCQFCDVPILYNEYALDIKKSKLYGRNLSQLRVSVMESSKEQDLEEQEPEKEMNSSSQTSKKYTVTVSNGDDKIGKITETWEEF